MSGDRSRTFVSDRLRGSGDLIACSDLFSRVLQRDEVYLANHSLGRPLDQTALDVQEALDLWYTDMDAAWDAWLAESNRWRGNVARLLGLSRPDGIVPKTSAGQGLRAVLNGFPPDQPVRVVTTTGEFDSIDFILKAYAAKGRAEVAWIPPAPLHSAEPIADALRGEPGLVVASLVFFATGQILLDAPALIEAAHAKGWQVLLDVYHAAGVIPVDLEALGADFAIGGSYKYLRGGPGACYLAIHPRHLDGPKAWRTLDTGWFAKKDTFGYGRSDQAIYADGGAAWLESTPPIVIPYQARAGLELVLELGVEALRKDSLDRQARMRSILRKQGLDLFEPENPEDYGAFSLLKHHDPAAFVRKLKDRGVNVDARGDTVRFGPDFLNTDEDFERVAQIWA